MEKKDLPVSRPTQKNSQIRFDFFKYISGT